MTITNTGNNYKFQAIMARRSSPKEVKLCKIKKDGKPGAAKAYTLLGCEQTAEDVIARLMNNNLGSTWIEA